MITEILLAMSELENLYHEYRREFASIKNWQIWRHARKVWLDMRLWEIENEYARYESALTLIDSWDN